MFGPQAFFMNKQLRINKGFFVAILSAFSDLDASVKEQIELRYKESLFYLLSRGVNKNKAKEMLITAFISEALDEIEDEGIKSAVSHYIDNWTSSFFHE